MTDQTWQWAELNSEQKTLLDEAEQTLGADYLLAYKQSEPSDAGWKESQHSSDLNAAQLSDSQLECLRGLETRLEAVVVAYQKATA
ncbi:MAG TPA: hypothetical protein VJ180_06900 [Pyrinomonadaceae bacterium]|nr:hypothetical protein [Pyrinomonadaceae bacterium]